MTAAVAISIVRWVIVLFAVGGNTGSFNVMISISGLCSLFLLPLNAVAFSMDRGLLFGVSNVMNFFFDRPFFFDIIVDTVSGIWRLSDWFVDGNGFCGAGTLTPYRNSLKI